MKINEIVTFEPYFFYDKNTKEFLGNFETEEKGCKFLEHDSFYDETKEVTDLVIFDCNMNLFDALECEIIENGINYYQNTLEQNNAILHVIKYATLSMLEKTQIHWEKVKKFIIGKN